MAFTNRPIRRHQHIDNIHRSSYATFYGYKGAPSSPAYPRGDTAQARGTRTSRVAARATGGAPERPRADTPRGGLLGGRRRALLHLPRRAGGPRADRMWSHGLRRLHPRPQALPVLSRACSENPARVPSLECSQSLYSLFAAVIRPVTNESISDPSFMSCMLTEYCTPSWTRPRAWLPR